MPPKKILFRLDAYYKIGSGHFYRCFALAEKLKKFGMQISFLGFIESEKLISKLKKVKIDFYNLDLSKEMTLDNANEYTPYSNKIQIENAIKTINLTNEYYDLIVIDSYKLDYIWEDQVSKITNKIMVIDDLSNRRHHCNILLDQTFGKKNDNYKSLVNTNCKLLVGEDFIILRDEFISAKATINNLNLKKNTALISFGGGKKELTYQACLELSSINSIDNFVVVLGPLDSSSFFNPFMNDSRFNFIKNTDNMGTLLANSSLVIGASGGSTWERLFMGIPSFQIIISENQGEISKILDEQKYIKLINDLSTLNFEVNKWINGRTAFKIFPHIDGKGLTRVVKEIVSL